MPDYQGGKRMELETIVKQDEFKEVIRAVVREELDQSFQDMDEIRRSPGGAIIRIEEDIKSMKQRIATIEQNMATKDDIKLLEAKITGLGDWFEGKFRGFEGKFQGLEGKFQGLEGRFRGLEGRFQGLEGKMKLITGLIFVMLTLYGALVVKLIFFQ